jgi:hypothetical protein
MKIKGEWNIFSFTFTVFLLPILAWTLLLSQSFIATVTAVAIDAGLAYLAFKLIPDKKIQFN